MSFTVKSASDLKDAKMKYCIYGDHSVRMVSLAKQVPNALVISMTGGIAGIANSNVDYIQVEKHGELINLIGEIKKGGEWEKYDWIFLDNITDLGQSIYPKLREKMEQEAESKSKNFDPRKAWGLFGEKVAQAVKQLRSINANTVVFLGVKEKEFDGISRRLPDVYGASAERILSWYDEVFYMFIDKDNNKKFLTDSTDKSMASDSSGKLEQIVDADLLKVHKKLTGGK